MTSTPASAAPDPGGRMARPDVLLLDVNETLSDMAPMAGRFADIGADPSQAATWFASVLRDGFARTAAGSPALFADVAAGVLDVLLEAHQLRGGSLDRDREDAVAHVMTGFTSLPVHADVVPGLRALAGAGLRLVTLTNGATSVADGLLERAGVRDTVERLLSVQDAGAWKPAPAAYAHGLRECGVAADRAMLVAVHPWDVDGASRAGLRSAWISRDDGSYPDHFARPDVVARSLTDLAEQLGRLAG